MRSLTFDHVLFVYSHYHGTVTNYDHKSMVSLSLCDKQGIRGSIRAFGQEIWILPSQYAFSDHNKNGMTYDITDEHIIYAQSVLKLHAEPKDMTDGDITRRRLARYNNGDNVIEVYLLADKTLVDHWKNEEGANWYSAMFTFLGDMINTADGYYRGTNWGSDIGTISIKWVALDIVESWSGIFYDLKNWQSGTYVDYLNKFRAWYAINKDMSDFDYAMIYASQPNFANEGNIGYSWYDSVCNNEYKNGMMSNTWDFLFNVRDQAELFSHELGHNLGARHDDSSTCSFVDPTYNIMKSNIGSNGFSACSISSIQQEFIDQDGYPCLIRRSNAFVNNYDESGSGSGITPTPPPTPSTGGGSGSYITVTILHSRDYWITFALSNTNGVSVRTIKIKASNSNTWISGGIAWYDSNYGPVYRFDGFDPWMSAPISVKMISSSGQEITSWNIVPSRSAWSTGTMTQSFSAAYTQSSDIDTTNGIGVIEWVAIIISISVLCICIIACVWYRYPRNKSKKEVTFNHGDTEDSSNNDQNEVEIIDGDKTDIRNTDHKTRIDDDSDVAQEIEVEVNVEIQAKTDDNTSTEN